MPGPFGLTPEGLNIPTFAELRQEISDEIHSTINPTLDLSDRSYEGQLTAIFCNRLISAYQLIQVAFGAMDVDQVEDASQDALYELTGARRADAQKSTVVLTLTGDDATSIPSLSLARVLAGPQFETLADDVVLVLLPVWVASSSYSVGDRVSHAAKCYRCTVAGSSGSVGPVGTTPTVVEVEAGSIVTWRFLGAGVAAEDVLSSCLVAGPFSAQANTVTTIASPVFGWRGVTNALDAAVGRDRMDNESYRVFREIILSRPGTGTPDALRAALIEVPGVETVTISNNFSDVVDADGVPPHSGECLIEGGDDQDIFDTIRLNCPFGIRSFGSISGTSTDSSGVEQPQAFSRPEPILVYVDVTLVFDVLLYPGDAAVKAVAATLNSTRGAGRDVVASAISAAVFLVGGIVDVSSVKIGVAPSPTLSTTIVMSRRQRARYDSTRFTVTSTAGEP